MFDSQPCLPALRDFELEAIFVSDDFEAYYESDMASLGLLEADDAELLTGNARP